MTVAQRLTAVVCALAVGVCLAILLQPGDAEGQAAVIASDRELARLFEADQAVRQGGFVSMQAAIEDRARRERVRELMAEGRVNSADDYWRAAFIFQHGDTPEDYLLAHALAVTSAGMGKGEATWIAAATLDRYLQAIGRSQIYGTQYQMAPGQPVSQGDYDRELVPDSVRVASGVPSLDQQAEYGRRFEQPGIGE